MNNFVDDVQAVEKGNDIWSKIVLFENRNRHLNLIQESSYAVVPPTSSAHAHIGIYGFTHSPPIKTEVLKTFSFLCSFQLLFEKASFEVGFTLGAKRF